jgi:hypothetical protein
VHDVSKVVNSVLLDSKKTISGVLEVVESTAYPDFASRFSSNTFYAITSNAYPDFACKLNSSTFRAINSKLTRTSLANLTPTHFSHIYLNFGVHIPPKITKNAYKTVVHQFRITFPAHVCKQQHPDPENTFEIYTLARRFVIATRRYSSLTRDFTLLSKKEGGA